MRFFCLEEFKIEFDKLSKKNSYLSINKEIIDYFFIKKIDQLFTGDRLNGSSENPYIKKRLEGRGGYRVYYLIMDKQRNVYLMFVHPKTGSLGYDNISNELKTYLYKQVLECIKSNNLYEITVKNKKLEFEKII